MFPWNTDFRFDAYNVVFLGAFFTVIAVVGGTFVAIAMKALRDVRAGRAAQLAWHEELSELPATARRCRHALTGEAPGRTCPRAFDCKGCTEHDAFVAARQGNLAPVEEPSAWGFALPADRLYHRGHAWVKPESDGSVTIGLDDLGRRLVGTPDAVELPPAGSQLVENGTAFRVRKQKARFRVAAPITGRVVETGGPDRCFYLRIVPDGPLDTRNLLSGTEAAAWLLGEWDRFQLALAGPRMVPALADGGSPVEDLSAVIPDEDRDRVLGEMFLEH